MNTESPPALDRTALSRLIARRVIHLVAPAVTSKDLHKACDRAVDDLLRAIRDRNQQPENQ